MAPAFPESAGVSYEPDGVPHPMVHGQTVDNAVSVAQWALQKYSIEPTQHRDEIRRAANWLVERQAADGGWYYDYFPEFPGMEPTLPARWCSGMAQGQAISLLIRASAVCDEPRFIAAAEKALMPFHVETDRGGVTAELQGHVFFEEFPTTPHSFVLNGFIFALLGLYDLASHGTHDEAATLFARGRTTLDAVLPMYDTGGLSAYHLGHITQPRRPIYINRGYHGVHLQLLAAIHDVAPSDVVARHLVKWARVYCSSDLREAVRRVGSGPAT